MKWATILLIRIYHISLSPLLLGSCRFEPSCSRYAEEAVRHYGVFYGMRLTIRRLIRCHPFYRHDLWFDPVR